MVEHPVDKDQRIVAYSPQPGQPFGVLHGNVKNKEGEVTYLNSGDWIENLTALEYNNGEWKIYHFHEDHPRVRTLKISKNKKPSLSNSQLFENLVKEFKMVKP